MGDLATLPHVTLVTLDVTNADSIQAAVGVVEKVTGGRLDYLVNNAGMFASIPFLMFHWKTPDDYLTQTCGGAVVNISSMASYMRVPWIGLYTMSKAALNMLGETLRLELLPFDVKVFTVITGAVDTQIFDNGVGVTLPEHSPYHPFLESIEKQAGIKADEDLFPSWMTADQFATKVANEGKTGLTWRRARASLVRFVTSCVWTGLIGRYMAYKSEL